MIHSLRKIAFAMAVAAFAVSGTATAQQQESVKTATNGDWDIMCLKGTELCRMEQYGKDPKGGRALLVRVERVSGAQVEGKQIPAFITILAPLGVLLPVMRATIDSGKPRVLPFERCIRTGCLASAPMVDDSVNELKKGSSLKVEFEFDPGKIIAVPVSLRGFTKSYNSLKPLPATRR